MKTTLLLFVFAFLGFDCFGQYARSIYSAETMGRRHHSLFEINGETTAISIRESSGDTLRVTLIDIDDQGETDNYRRFDYLMTNLSSVHALSGVGVNSSGEVTMAILSQNTNSSMDVHHIVIDPSTGAFSSLSTIAGQFKRAFSRTRVKGDSLITYAANFSSTGISRITRSLSSPNFSIEPILFNTSFSGTLSTNNVACELIIDGTDEYIATSNQIVKRIGPNNFIDSSYSGVFSAPTITMTSSGELFVLEYSGDYQLLDANLMTTNSGTIPELQTNLSNTPTEMYPLPNGGIRIWSKPLSSATSRVIDLSSNLTITENRMTRGLFLDQFILDGKQYLVGFDNALYSDVDTDGNPFQQSASNLTVVFDDLSTNVAEFIEFDQTLNTENIEFHANHTSRSFTNQTEGTSGFTFEQNGIDRSLIYAATSNILGTTVNGGLVGAANTYNLTQVTGPYCAPGSYSLEVMDKYNRGYYVTREMIETHLYEITANPSYEIPFGIREWPAHGDITLGQAANLADFYDQNGNGTYEPELGDYPSIYGDQCLLNVYHQHPGSIGSASIETHQYYFTFDCDSSEVMENTVFIRTHNFNRGQSLFNVYEGDHVDFDIGNALDDYFGTNIELAMIYGYNGDMFDETNGASIGFNDTVPAVGMISLQGMKLDDDGIDNMTTTSGGPQSNGIGFNDGIPDNEFYTMESSYGFQNFLWPNTLWSWQNTMLGTNPDGSPKMVNGVDVRHDYFGTSDPLFYSSYGIDHGNNNSEAVASNVVGDRRMSCASGPGSFLTTDTLVLLKAYLVGVDTVNLSPDSSVVRLFERGQELRDLFAQNNATCGNTFDSYVSSSVLAAEEEEIERITAYPNPANQHIQFKGIVGQASLNIFDINGRVVLSVENVDDYQSIDISSLDKAIYLINIHDKNGSQTIRMIKQ